MRERLNTPIPCRGYISYTGYLLDGRRPKMNTLIDAKAASALLGVPATWIRAEARADRVPHVRLGRYVRFDAAELEVWWRARARGPWRS